MKNVFAMFNLLPTMYLGFLHSVFVGKQDMMKLEDEKKETEKNLREERRLNCNLMTERGGFFLFSFSFQTSYSNNIFFLNYE